MSEELSETTDQNIDNNQQSEDVSRETNDNEQKPAGYHPVDLSDLPPEKQEALNDRIKYLYTQVKDNERKYKNYERDLTQYKTIAQQQAQAIDDLMNGVGRVVDHLETKSVQETEASLRQKMQDAFDAGDNKGYVSTQQELNKLQIQQTIQKQNKPAKNETQKLAYAGRVSASSMAQEAVQDGELEPRDAQFVSAWQEETNERGEPLRPWSSTEDIHNPDPDYVKALVITRQVWEKYPNRTMKENLAEIDKRMGVQIRQSGQTVMGGSLTTQGKNTKLTLSPKQQEIAVRTKFGGPTAKSDADHMAAYRKQIEKVQSSQRSR